METKYSNHQNIADITVVALFTAMILAINAVLKIIMGFDISIFLILVCTIFFKNRISLGICLTSAFLSFFINADILMTCATIISTSLFWIFCVNLKIILYRYFALTYLSLIIFSILKYMFVYVFWFALFDKQTAISMYSVYTVEMHFMLIGYCLMPLFITKKIFAFFKNVKSMNQYYFNQKIINEIKGEITMKIFSNEKKHYQQQFASLIISMMVMVGALCYIPYAASVWLGNYHWAAIVFVTPFCMTFFTPLWLKRKKKVGNKKQLETNWIGILFGLTAILIPTCFNFQTSSKVIQIHFLILFLLGIIIFSIFMGGAIPMNIEIIKSYNLRNNQPDKIRQVLGLTCFWLVPFVIIFNVLNLNYLSVITLLVPTFVVLILMISNQNIFDKGNVLNINKENFKLLKQDKKFLSVLVFQSYLYGLSKFFEFGALILFFLPIFKNGVVIDQNSWKLGLMVCAIFLVKYLTQAIFRFTKLSEKNCKKINILGASLISTGILMLLAFWICTYFIMPLKADFNLLVLFYFLTICTAGAFVAGGATILEKSKANIYKTIVVKEAFGEAMLLDHVAGNALFNLVINLVFLLTVLVIPNSNFVMSIFWGVVFIITSAVVISNSILITNNNKIISKN